MSYQVLLEKAVVASILHKSLVHFELKFHRHHDLYHRGHPHHIIVILIGFMKS